MKRALVLSCGGFKVAMQAIPIQTLTHAFQYQGIFGTSGGVLNAILAAQNSQSIIKIWKEIQSQSSFLAPVPWTGGRVLSLEPLRQQIPEYLTGAFTTPCYASWVAANTLTHHLTEISTLPVNDLVNIVTASCTMSPRMFPHRFVFQGKTYWGIDGWFKSAIQIPPGQWDAIDVISTIPYSEISSTTKKNLLAALLPHGMLTFYCTEKPLGDSLTATPELQASRIRAGLKALQHPVQLRCPLA